MYSKRLLLIAVAAVTLLFTGNSCEKQTYQTIEELDNENINRYIQENNLSVERYKNTDLFYQVIRPGTGRSMKFSETYPLVFTINSLDGTFQAKDTLSANNRYYDYLGYFPFGSVAAGISNSPVERQDDLKYVVRDILKNTNGQIRIIVPSRLTAWGRRGDRTLGIPPNASLDYTISVHDNAPDYEDAVMQHSIINAGMSVEQFTKSEDNIYYRILNPGTGDVITKDSIVTVDYSLRDPAGELVESYEDVRLNLAGGTIKAWTEMLPLIRKGGKIRFFSPSAMAYGLQGASGIPPFMSLDFEVSIKE